MIIVGETLSLIVFEFGFAITRQGVLSFHEHSSFAHNKLGNKKIKIVKILNIAYYTD